MTRPSAAAPPTVGTLPPRIQPERHVLPCGHRLHRLDGLVGELGEINGLSVELELARLDRGEEEQVVDQVRHRIEIGAHRTQEALRIRRQSVLQRLDRSPQRCQRAAQIVADGGEEVASRPVVGVPLRFGFGELARHAIHRVCGGAELIQSRHARASGEVAIGDPRRRPSDLAEPSRELTGQGGGEHDAESHTEAEHDRQQLQVVRLEEHEAGGHAGRDGDRGHRGHCHDENRRAEGAKAPRRPGQQPSEEGGARSHGDEEQQQLGALAPRGTHRHLEEPNGENDRRTQRGYGPHGSNR